MKVFLASLIAMTTLFGATYEYNYDVIDTNATTKERDFFMYGDFEEIIRFEPIYMEDRKSNDHYKTILEKIQELEENKREFFITVLGHTDTPTDDVNEKTLDSNTYANWIQNLFRYSLDTNSSLDRSTKYADAIKDKMLDDEVDEKRITVEYRSGNENLYTEDYNKFRKKNDRVMVTLYLAKAEDIDSDRDGVFDSVDKCPNSPRGYPVDKDGCSIDSDGDGVIDYKDECPNTPEGVPVDTKGCPLDSDGDGVADYKDECPNTPVGMNVDAKGCPIFKALALKYKTASAEILQESMPEVLEFAAFMAVYEEYKAEIIGHTDSVGKEDANMKLSQARAESVKAALIAEGIAAERLITKGRGELEPIADNRSLEGRQENRRIEVKLFE
ncbi:MAG: OmpA family protein [Sulfurimonadaceae bacterium]|jgi:outer membrane protein OmpA-like peptidoglycan-associated protein|nr:OmpA family protein [Sulfurimonadaceae bacterium]